MIMPTPSPFSVASTSCAASRMLRARSAAMRNPSPSRSNATSASLE
jgi:hypothetical protein